MHDLAGSQFHDEIYKHGAKEQVIRLHKIARPDLVRMIRQERRPGLAPVGATDLIFP